MARAQPGTDAQTSAPVYCGLTSMLVSPASDTHSRTMSFLPGISKTLNLGRLWQLGRRRTKGVAINALPTKWVIWAAGQLCQLPFCKREQPSAPLLHLLAGTTGICISPTPSIHSCSRPVKL